ncbi:hypothetical protein BK138_32055 [Paenibacillus rhizosphaerae]|uniref:DUF2642 domain-containing protein n=1 Tax=Paenibacillus rhizosphaerae TaxID=297318 RepID=A0A1R1E614_9BACL|nr:hypothetical protein BK138_32055 [Paenibacillus rhizosphaerae]
MIDELLLAAAYGQSVLVKLKDRQEVIGKALISCFTDRTKILTSQGTVWVIHKDIDYVERLVDH